ncbi:uncharacterized protein LOC143508715 [Brachyhypopomus gauderio]|uniref:uncharacterized protein LOC143487755 n=1 Tax=Brachyhypopomus gauderio TaxID=698409 RepID=UPI0040424E57
MFSKASGPYARPPPMKVKCVGKHTAERAETYEMVDGVVAVKTSKRVATCALCDGQNFVVAHLKNDDCDQIDDNQSYFIKGYNISQKYGNAKVFFTTSTVVYKTSDVAVSRDLEVQCRHAVCPPSPVYQTDVPNWTAVYSTLCGRVTSLSTTRLQNTKDGDVPVRNLEVMAGSNKYEVALWRDAALEDVTLSANVDITHLHIKKQKDVVTFNSTTYTTIKKSEMAVFTEEVEVVGICPTPTAVKILTANMEEFSIPPHVWSGDTDKIILELPFKMLVKHTEGVIESFECPFFP